METQVVGELGMKSRDQHVAFARHHRVTVDLSEHLHPAPGVLDPGSADEHGPQRLVAEPPHRDVLLEAPYLATERVAARLDVHQAEVRAVEHDQPGARAEDRTPGADEVAYRLFEAPGLELDVHRRALPAWDHESIEPFELAGVAHLSRARAQPLERGAVGLEAALHGKHADAGPESLV